MKKLFQKNQMIITTLAVIIAVAGYVNLQRKNMSQLQKTKTKAVSKHCKRNCRTGER